MSNPTKLTIGADPEIAIVKPQDHNWIGAQHVFRPTDNPFTSEFGYDGNPDTLELRPAYTTDPLKLAENIDGIFQRARKNYPEVFKYELRASHRTLSVGGHIQFGHPIFTGRETPRPHRRGATRREYHTMAEISSLQDQLMREAQTPTMTTRPILPTNPSAQLIHSLDLLLALPMSFVEIPSDAKERKGHFGYGHWGASRSQNWGIEYRTLPSWLASRRLTEATLSLAYAIAWQVIKENSVIAPKAVQEDTYRSLGRMFDACDLPALRFFLPQIMRTIHTLDRYKDFKPQINYLLLSSRAGRPLLDIDVRVGWRIEFVKEATRKLLSLSSFVKNLTKQIETAQSQQPISSNLQFFGYGNDWRTKEIAGRTAVAMSKMVEGIKPEDLTRRQFQSLMVRGLKRDKGNKIILDINSQFHTQRLIESIKTVYNSTPLKAKELTIEYHEPDYRVGRAYGVFLSRDIREQGMLAEALMAVVWLYINRGIYKSKIKRRDGKEVTRPFSTTALRPLGIMAKKEARAEMASRVIQDEGEIDIRALRELINEQYLPMIAESLHEERRAHIPQEIFSMITTVAEREEDEDSPCNPTNCHYYNLQSDEPAVIIAARLRQCCDRHFFGVIHANCAPSRA